MKRRANRLAKTCRPVELAELTVWKKTAKSLFELENVDP
jgi:hypothetical protein